MQKEQKARLHCLGSMLVSFYVITFSFFELYNMNYLRSNIMNDIIYIIYVYLDHVSLLCTCFTPWRPPYSKSACALLWGWFCEFLVLKADELEVEAQISQDGKAQIVDLGTMDLGTQIVDFSRLSAWKNRGCHGESLLVAALMHMYFLHIYLLDLLWFAWIWKPTISGTWLPTCI